MTGEDNELPIIQYHRQASEETRRSGSKVVKPTELEYNRSKTFVYNPKPKMIPPSNPTPYLVLNKLDFQALDRSGRNLHYTIFLDNKMLQNPLHFSMKDYNFITMQQIFTRLTSKNSQNKYKYNFQSRLNIAYKLSDSLKNARRFPKALDVSQSAQQWHRSAKGPPFTTLKLVLNPT